MSAIDLTRLPPPSFDVTLDFEAILAELKADLVGLHPTIAPALELPSEPITKLMEAFAYRIMVERERYNHSALQVLMAYAAGADLDHIGVTYYRVERLENETDSAYRDRMLLSLEGQSAAGSDTAYQFHARTVSPDIADVSAINGGAGVALITVLSALNNGTPSPELLADIYAALHSERVKPLNDSVQVQAATVHTYSIVATLTTGTGPSAEVVRQNALASAQAYHERRKKLGMGITRDGVLAALWVEGVEHIELTSPVTDIAATKTESAWCTSFDVSVYE